MALGKVLALANANGSIKELLKRGFCQEKEITPLNKESYVRVSALADLCPREEVLCSVNKVTREETVEPDLSMIFAHGTALHWVLQNQVLPKVGILIGVWKCFGCGKAHGQLIGDNDLSALVLRPDRCNECGTAEFTYVEQHFINKEFRITGHPDGFLVIPGLPGKGIIEAKSIGQAWKVKQTPQMDHVIQAQCYLWLTGLKWAKILYWEKGGHGLSALTEHHVERDEDTLVEIKKALTYIWNGIDGGALPERICADKGCPRAKGCPVVDICFEEK